MREKIDSQVTDVERTPDIFYKDRSSGDMRANVSIFLEEFHSILFPLILIAAWKLLELYIDKAAALSIAFFVTGMFRYVVQKRLRHEYRMNIAKGTCVHLALSIFIYFIVRALN
jgi:hypothetical protein